MITNKGIIIIVGCSHPDMGTILDTARQFGTIYGIIGGLHEFSDYALFQDLELLCPVHYARHITVLKRLYPENILQVEPVR